MQRVVHIRHFFRNQCDRRSIFTTFSLDWGQIAGRWSIFVTFSKLWNRRWSIFPHSGTDADLYSLLFPKQWDGWRSILVISVFIVERMASIFATFAQIIGGPYSPPFMSNSKDQIENKSRFRQKCSRQISKRDWNDWQVSDQRRGKWIRCRLRAPRGWSSFPRFILGKVRDIYIYIYIKTNGR